jgi:hypothetical protein
VNNAQVLALPVLQTDGQEFMRLNGWQRLGIGLSIIWAVGAAIHQRNSDVEHAENFAKFAYKVCSDAKSLAQDNNLASCEQERNEHLVTWLKGSWGNVAFLALVPIPFGWLAALILINVSRAQVIGFRTVLSWATSSVLKKIFVVFCALASGAVILFGFTAALNLYVDTEVPVSLGLRAMVIKTGEDMVTAAGTWTRSGLTEGSAMGYPLQTSRIMCNRQERRCSEARASVSGNTLMSDLVEYEVESWSTTTIVFKTDSLCTTEVFTIDLKTESVNGAGHRNKDEKFCNPFESKEEHWNYRLSDGFKVYWEQRQRARPLPLRIIQSFFGN